MNIPVLVVSALFLIGTQIESSIALNCYACGILGCADPFNPSAIGVTKFQSTTGWCAKIRTSVQGQVGIVRGPDLFPCTKTSCDKSTYQGSEANICCCNSELCNGAPHSTSMMIIAFFISFLVLGVSKYFY